MYSNLTANIKKDIKQQSKKCKQTYVNHNSQLITDTVCLSACVAYSLSMFCSLCLVQKKLESISSILLC